jgi:hypothetical protein
MFTYLDRNIKSLLCKPRPNFTAVCGSNLLLSEMLPIIVILLYMTGFVGSTSNYGLTVLSSFHHTINGSGHGGGLKLDSDSLAGHTYIRCRGTETPLPSANLEPETSGTEVTHARTHMQMRACMHTHTHARMHTHTHTHTLYYWNRCRTIHLLSS